jgi:hypothetical protein
MTFSPLKLTQTGPAAVRVTYNGIPRAFNPQKRNDALHIGNYLFKDSLGIKLEISHILPTSKDKHSVDVHFKHKCHGYVFGNELAAELAVPLGSVGAPNDNIPAGWVTCEFSNTIETGSINQTTLTTQGPLTIFLS